VKRPVDCKGTSLSIGDVVVSQDVVVPDPSFGATVTGFDQTTISLRFNHELTEGRRDFKLLREAMMNSGWKKYAEVPRRVR
jgi:hypothetical protein